MIDIVLTPKPWIGLKVICPYCATTAKLTADDKPNISLNRANGKFLVLISCPNCNLEFHPYVN